MKESGGTLSRNRWRSKTASSHQVSTRSPVRQVRKFLGTTPNDLNLTDQPKLVDRLLQKGCSPLVGIKQHPLALRPGRCQN